MVGAAGVFAGAAATGNERWLGDFVSAARGALVRLPAEAPRASAELAQIEVLGATVKTLSAAVDSALRAQRGSTAASTGTLVLAGVPIAAAAYYLRNHGWWVTAQQLQDGLEGVRRDVCERLEEVRLQLLERIGILERQGEQTAAWQQEVRLRHFPAAPAACRLVAALCSYAPRMPRNRPCQPMPPPRFSASQALALALAGVLPSQERAALTQPCPMSPPHRSRAPGSRSQQSVAMAELAGKLQGVHDSVGTLEQRLEGVKGDVARSARGVELLCEFVATASAPGDSARQDQLQERLQAYTGLTHRPASPDLNSALPPQPLPWAAPQQTGYLTSVLSGRVSPNN